MTSSIDAAQRSEPNVIVRLQRRIDTLEMEKVSLQKQVTELKAEIAEYDRQLNLRGGPEDEVMKWQLANTIGLTPSELLILNLLMERTEGMSRDGIMQAMYSHGHAASEVPEQKIIDVFMCKLRRKLRDRASLPHDAIQTIWGKGYRINPQRRQEVAAFFTVDGPEDVD